MKNKKALASFGFVATMLLLFLSFLSPPVYGASVSQSAFKVCTSSPTSCTAIFTNPTVKGDTMVAVCTAYNAGSLPGNVLPDFSVADAQPQSFTKVAGSPHFAFAGSTYGVFIYQGLVGAALNNDAITCQVNNGHPTVIYVQIYELSTTMTFTDGETGTCSSACTTSVHTGLSSTLASGDIAIAGYVCTGGGCPGGGGWTAGASYTRTGNAGDNGIGEYANAIAGTTNYPMTMGTAGSAWAGTGAAFTPANNPSTTSTSGAVGGTTITVTNVGWLVPDGSHWNNGINAFLFPIMGAAIFSMMGKMMDLDKNVPTLTLIGLTIGAVLGMLSLGGTTGGNIIPFALPIVAAVDLILWVWQGAD